MRGTVLYRASSSKLYPRLRKKVLQTPEHKTPRSNLPRPYNPFSQRYTPFFPYLHTVPMNDEEQDQLYLSYRHSWSANPEQDSEHLMSQDKDTDFYLPQPDPTTTLCPRLNHTLTLRLSRSISLGHYCTSASITSDRDFDPDFPSDLDQEPNPTPMQTQPMDANITSLIQLLQQQVNQQQQQTNMLVSAITNSKAQRPPSLPPIHGDRRGLNST